MFKHRVFIALTALEVLVLCLLLLFGQIRADHLLATELP